MKDEIPGRSTVLTNARLVLDDEVVSGSVALRDGRIVSVDTGGTAVHGAQDMGGAWLMPGLIELHTDNLEKHLRPRPGVIWPSDAAVVAHDGELASVGITTVFDALRIGSLVMPDKKLASHRYALEVAGRIGALAEAEALRVSHLLHLRAELCSHTVLEELDEFAGDTRVRIVSIMDHTPGQRQFANMEKYRQYYKGKKGFSDVEMDAYIAHNLALSAEVSGPHETGVAERARAMGAVIASHDDTTADHARTSVETGVGFAEFPTTAEAARVLSQASVPVMMGAPNVLRGGSHSGNVAAMELAQAGLLDILSSDYAPSSLLMGAMRLARETGDLPGAIRRVTAAPAAAAGLEDRGRIAEGLRADLIAVREVGDLAVVTDVLVAGRKVA